MLAVVQPESERIPDIEDDVGAELQRRGWAWCTAEENADNDEPELVIVYSLVSGDAAEYSAVSLHAFGQALGDEIVSSESPIDAGEVNQSRNFIDRPGGDGIASAVGDLLDAASGWIEAQTPTIGSGDSGRQDVLDSGLALVQPITTAEYHGVTRLLSLLWQAIDSDEGLTETQRAQVLAMAELIRTEHREAEPDQTQRWRLVAVVRASLRYIFSSGGVRDAAALMKLVEVLNEIGWPTVAKMIS